MPAARRAAMLCLPAQSILTSYPVLMAISDHSPAWIRALSPYQPGKPITELARELGLTPDSIVKLASNENPLGMSPRAHEAVSEALSGGNRYPDPFELIQALAHHCQVASTQIVLGNGSNDVLDLIARAFLAPGASAVMSQYAFAVYPLATQSCGAQCLVASAKDYGHDLAALRALVRLDTRIVWLANPNNPTGAFIPLPDLKRFIASLPAEVLVVLDEAYNEYLEPELRGDSIAWLSELPNLVITRSFSKIYGLAGLRVGYAVAHPEIADLMNRVRQPFNVNNLALAAALAALSDTDFVRLSHQLNLQGKAQILSGLARLNLCPISDQGNFVTFAVADAAKVNQFLLKQGVIVRPLAGYGLPQHLRVTIGLESENTRFLAALAAALK